MISPRRLRLLLILPLVIFMSGCAIKFIYNQLDWLIPWYLDDFVTLDPLQEVQFEAQLEQYLTWHRQQQLPVYADFLESIAQASADGLNKEEVEQIQTRSELFADQLFTRLGPSLVELFKTLEDEQLVEMYENFATENEKYREKFIDKKEVKQRYKRRKEMRKFIERWTGVLDEAQQDKIIQWSQRYELMGQDFLQSRFAWQSRLKEILQQRHTGEAFDQALFELFGNRRLGRPAGFNQKLKHNQNLLKQLYLDIDQSLTSRQRQRMINKLNGYADDFRELSRQ